MIQDKYGAKSLYALEYHKILGLLMERAKGLLGEPECHDIKYATVPRISN